LGGLFLGFVLGSFTGHGETTAQRATWVTSDESVGTRTSLWRGALPTIAASPVAGHGPDGLYLAFPRHRPPGLDGVFAREDLVAQSTHNWVLDAAASTGLPGLGFFLLFLATSAGLTLRAQRAGGRQVEPRVASPGERERAAFVLAAGAGYLLLGLVNPASLAPQALSFVLLGVLAGRAEGPPAAPSHGRGSLPVLRFAGAGGVLAALCFVAVAVFVADRQAQRGWDAYARDDFQAAARAYHDAARWNPVEPAYARSEARSLLAAGARGDQASLGRAQAAFERLERSFGLTSADVLDLAAARVGLGEPAGSILSLADRALRLNPHGIRIQSDVAALRAAAGGGVLYYSEEERAVRVAPAASVLPAPQP
jgi:hypothetical protein